MNDQDLARALFEAGLLTQAQVQSAAERRSAEKSFAQVIVDLGWVTAAQVRQVDPGALPGYVDPITSPSAWQTTSPTDMPGSGYSSGSGYSMGGSNPPSGSYPAGGGFQSPYNAPYQTPGAPPIPQPGGYGTGYPGYPPGGYPEAVSGTTVLVLGIVGVTLCGICAPIAWIQGNTALRAIDAGRADPAQRSMASIGRILGIIGTTIILLYLFFLLMMMMLTVTGRRVSNTFSPSTVPPSFNAPPPSFAPAPGQPLR